MADYPRDLRDDQVSPELAALIFTLATRILSGATPTHRELLAQLAHAVIDRVTLTGAGLYAYFRLPDHESIASHADMIGGDVPMDVEGLDAGAGCLIAVSDGKLDFLEIFTFGSVAWPDRPKILAFGDATPLPISDRAT